MRPALGPQATWSPRRNDAVDHDLPLAAELVADRRDLERQLVAVHVEAHEGGSLLARDVPNPQASKPRTNGSKSVPGSCTVTRPRSC